MSKVIILYDGDILAYRASAAIDGRSVLVKHNKTKRTKEFKNKTEFYELCKEKNLEIDKDDYTIIDQQNPEPIATACSIIKNQIERINADLFADEYLVCISGKSNFRDNLPLPSKYKGGRSETLRPVHLKECKKYLWKSHPSLIAKDREADDDLIIKGYEYLSKGYQVIIAGIDKDSWSSSGLSLYNYTEEAPKLELLPDFGYLTDTGKKIIGRGFLWLMFQQVLGDKTDSFNPAEIAGVKYGDKSAYKLLKDTTTKQEALQLVVDQYKKWYPNEVTYTDWTGKKQTKDYRAIFQMYFSCARMMQHEHDKLNAENFCKQHGVKL
jgi:hypothetical protein